MMNARRFILVRKRDITGMSGTGVVAEGIVFTDSTAVLRWREVTGANYERGVRATTVIFPSIGAVEALHGHDGATIIKWLDPNP